MAGRNMCESANTFLTPKGFSVQLTTHLTGQVDGKKWPFAGIRILKRKRDLKDGDFIVPPGQFKEQLSDSCVSKCRDLCMKHPDQKRTPIDSVKPGSHCPFTISLHRRTVFKEVLSHVRQTRENYGTVTCRSRDTAFLYVPDFGSDSEVSQSGLPLSYMRTVLVLKHVRQLLKASGFSVKFVHNKVKSHKTEQMLELMDVRLTSCQQSDTSMKQLIQTAMESRYRRLAAEISHDHGDRACGPVDSDDNITLDLRIFLDENPALRGYDKNIHFADVMLNGQPTDLMHQVNLLEEAWDRVRSVPTGDFHKATVLHITPHSRSFTQQQVDLLWRILSKSRVTVEQGLIVHGPVTVSSGVPSTQVTTESFHSLIKSEMKEAAVLKYGEQVKGEGWDRNINTLTLATLTFEILSSTCKNTVKLSLTGSGKRSGTFLMYNCARLATLFSHFEQAVHKGTYPPLPPVEEVDFSTLKEEDEWALLFNYVWSFPDVVAESVSSLTSPETSTTDIHTHKVCSFLVSLSQQVSAYYSRCHILGESRPHLYQVMFARLYLMKAVHQVMKNGLALLEIEPLSQL